MAEGRRSCRRGVGIWEGGWGGGWVVVGFEGGEYMGMIYREWMGGGRPC